MNTMNDLIRLLIVATTGFLILMFIAASVDARNAKISGMQMNRNGIKKAECGFEYKVVYIEGKRFLAYQTSYGHWEVTQFVE